MSRTTDLRLLTGIALLCRAAAGFPVWLAVLALRTGDGALLGTCCGILTAGAFAVMLWRRFADRICSPRIASALSVTGAAAASAACTVLLLHFLPGAYFTAGSLSAVTFFIVLRGSGRETAALFSPSYFSSFLTAAVIVTVLRSLTELRFPSGLLFGVTAAVCALWMILRNQLMLHRLICRRSDAGGTLPPEIRRSNLRLVLLIILLTAAVLLFREPLFRFAAMLGGALKQLALICVRALSAVYRWLSGNELPPDDIEQVPAGETPPPPQEGSPLWSLLLILLVPIIIVFWKIMLSDFFFALREMWQRFRARFAGARNRSAVSAAEDGAEYTDTETAARPENTAKKQRRSWNRALRAWHRQPDSAEKFYAGYALMLKAPAWEPDPPKPAETADEIRQRWAQTHEDVLGRMTEDLHADRYAQTGLPAGALSDAAAALESLRHMKER